MIEEKYRKALVDIIEIPVEALDDKTTYDIYKDCIEAKKRLVHAKEIAKKAIGWGDE